MIVAALEASANPIELIHVGTSGLFVLGAARFAHVHAVERGTAARSAKLLGPALGFAAVVTLFELIDRIGLRL